MSGLDAQFGPGTRARLADIIRLCERAELFAARGKDWYEGDPELQTPKLAGEALVLKLGEAVRRLPADLLQAQRADPDWRRAIGMRHRLAHEYDAVDHTIVWQVLAVHATALRHKASALLEQD